MKAAAWFYGRSFHSLPQPKEDPLPRQTETRPDWLQAHEEYLQLEKLMWELEAHVEKHDREEFGTCEVRDRDVFDVRNKLERHVKQWTSTWAEQAAELYGQKELLARVLQVQRVELTERITGDNPRWDVWLLDLIRAIQKALRAVGIEPYSAELRMP